jgi:hypothetical protein
VFDDVTTIYSAVIIGSVTDEILGDFLSAGFTVAASRPDLQTTATATGLYAVTGYPDQSFPLLDTMGYSVDLVMSAPGFISQSLTVPIPQHSVFPVSKSAVALRRLPTRIQGRVVNKTTRAPIAGALILSIDDPATPPTVHATVLRSPLYTKRTDGTQVQLVTMAMGGAAHLNEDATGGDNVLILSDRTGLGPNSIVQLSNGSKTTIEYAMVNHLGPGAANQPGQVFLRHPLNSTFAKFAGSTVQFVTTTPTGSPALLAGDANAGDNVLMATQLLNGTTLAIDPATPAQTEYHEVGAWTDSGGYYSISGAGRTRELFLQASKGTLKSLVDWFVDYDRTPNIVDFQL